MRVLLGETKNGHGVYVDMQSSHAATHIADDPPLLDLIKEALPELELTEDQVRIEKDMGRVAGAPMSWKRKKGTTSCTQNGLVGNDTRDS